MGPKPIETILPGDLVLNRDLTTGALRWKPVLKATTRPPAATIAITLEETTSAPETFRCSTGHLFWVSGKGWKKASELKENDILHGAKTPVRIARVEEQPIAQTFNLEVADAPNYFVGRNMILSHDVTPRETNRKRFWPGPCPPIKRSASCAENRQSVRTSKQHDILCLRRESHSLRRLFLIRTRFRINILASSATDRLKLMRAPSLFFGLSASLREIFFLRTRAMRSRWTLLFVPALCVGSSAWAAENVAEKTPDENAAIDKQPVEKTTVEKTTAEQAAYQKAEDASTATDGALGTRSRSEGGLCLARAVCSEKPRS